MSSIPHLTDAVETLLRAGDDPLPRATRQRLARFVVGVLLAGTVVLRRVATTQTHIARGAAQAARHERRLRRIVHVHLQETFSDVVKTDKTGLSKTAHTRWMISAFASQRTDVPLCKRRTDFLYGSK